jgi:small-conductance mechanosensitive channel/CRP-like cAMP-binding protein
MGCWRGAEIRDISPDLREGEGANVGWAALVDEMRGDWSLWALGGLVVATLAVRTLQPAERPRLRTFWVLYLLHLVLVVVTAMLREDGSPAHVEVQLAARIFGAVVLIGAASNLLFRVLAPRLELRPPLILADVAGAGATAVAVLLLASEAGFNLGGLIATSAVLTAVIGLSLQDTLGNVMGGLAIQSDDSLRVGDWVRMGETTGRVVQIRWRYTAIQTRNREMLIVPNGMLVKERVVVLGRIGDSPSPLRRWVWFNVDFEESPDEVVRVVEEALRGQSIERVAADPPPDCVPMELGNSYARYAVRYWLTDLAVDDPTDGRIRTRIYLALRRAGMSLALPTEARVVSESAGREAETERADRADRIAALKDIDLFAHLPDEDLELLARGLRHTPFGRDETLTRQGSQAHWLYLVRRGLVSVRVTGEGGLEREVARLGSGTFFGEMSLMTGAPRSATVVALEHVECYRLDQHVFRRLLAQRPALAEEMSRLLAARQVELDATREGLDAEAQRRAIERTSRDLVNRIRAFFHLDG